LTLFHGLARDEYWRKDYSAVKKHLVLYDDECPLCVFQMKLLTWLDWLHVATVVPLSSERAREVAPQLDRETLRAAMHVVAADGRIYRGARCIRFLALRMPLLVPLGLLLWVPGMIWIAEIIYAHVANNRMFLSRVFGCKDACSVMPARRREHDKLA
jgi:predicted DCC family thiol-disulfide oxidoreductase YuxK